MDEDALIDIIRRVHKRLGIEIEDGTFVSIEAEIRHEYGGDRIYIGRTRADRRSASRRDLLIWNLHHAGERDSTLALRFGISPRRVRQIVAEQEEIRKRP